MSESNLWSRWHRFNNNGVKFIKRFGVNEIPDPLIEEGYTEWRRGTGPLQGQTYENVVNGVRRFHTGLPKSETTKYKMSQAKLGVPKTEEHKANMSRAWKRKRIERYQKVMQNLVAQK
jgi:hypothetical protein